MGNDAFVGSIGGQCGRGQGGGGRARRLRWLCKTFAVAVQDECGTRLVTDPLA